MITPRHSDHDQINGTMLKIANRWQETGTVVGVGIDPDIKKIPAEYRQLDDQNNLKIVDTVFKFSKAVIDATGDQAVDFKVNPAFFQGSMGRTALHEIFGYLKSEYPSVIRVCDGKFADIGNSADKIAEEVFGVIDADAVLLNPYMGNDAIEPFSSWKDKASIVCVNTSNPSSETIQDLILANGQKLWQHILDLSMNDWNENNNIIPIMSATHPDNLVDIRKTIGQSPVLVAGIGSQGGDIQHAVKHCADEKGQGMLISASRAIIFPDQSKGLTHPEAVRQAFENFSKLVNMAIKNVINE